MDGKGIYIMLGWLGWLVGCLMSTMINEYPGRNAA